MMIKSITIPGKPVGKARPRFNRKAGTAYTPKSTFEYEKTVAKLWKLTHGNFQFEEDVPLFADVIIYQNIPKSTPKKEREKMLSGKVFPTKKPDIDNVLKILLDALNGIAYADDKQVIGAHIVKRYSEEPRVVIGVGKEVCDG